MIRGGTPKTKAFKDFLEKEKDRVTGFSFESPEYDREKQSVWIYTDSTKWCADDGSGSFRGSSETNAIKQFYRWVRKAG